MDRYPVSYHSFKILLLGSNSVGKTSLLPRFTHNTFTINLPTLGVEPSFHKLIIDNQRVKFEIWDSAGQDRHRMMIGPYYERVGIIFLVYNICDRQSFQDLDNWLKEVEKETKDDVKMLLIGNKCDEEKERQVSYEEGQAYADKLGIRFIETSAKHTVNVENAFTMILKELMTEKTHLKFLRYEYDVKSKCY